MRGYEGIFPGIFHTDLDRFGVIAAQWVFTCLDMFELGLLCWSLHVLSSYCRLNSCLFGSNNLKPTAVLT